MIFNVAALLLAVASSSPVNVGSPFSQVAHAASQELATSGHSSSSLLQAARSSDELFTPFMRGPPPESELAQISLNAKANSEGALNPTRSISINAKEGISSASQGSKELSPLFNTDVMERIRRGQKEIKGLYKQFSAVETKFAQADAEMNTAMRSQNFERFQETMSAYYKAFEDKQKILNKMKEAHVNVKNLRGQL